MYTLLVGVGSRNFPRGGGMSWRIDCELELIARFMKNLVRFVCVLLSASPAFTSGSCDTGTEELVSVKRGIELARRGAAAMRYPY